MKKNKLSEDALGFILGLNYINENTNIENIDSEAVFIYRIWHKIISVECAEIYSKEKIRNIKKKLLKDLKNNIELIKKNEKIGFDNILFEINQTEQTQLSNLINTIRYINDIDETELKDLIVESFFNSKENMQFLLEEKEKIEKEKFKDLTYKGQNCVEEEGINTENLKKIYDQIKGEGLINISKRVNKLVKTDKEFMALQQAKVKARKIITLKVLEIYNEKLTKITKEIKEGLKELSKNEYNEDYVETENFNIVRLKSRLLHDLKQSKKGIKGMFKTKKRTRMKEILSMVTSTINHKNFITKYQTELLGFDMTNELEEVYSKSEVAKEIEIQKEDLLNHTGVIINNLNQNVIDVYTSRFIKEINEKTEEINNKIKYLATKEEKDKVNNFAKTMGMSIEKALELLRDDNNVYTCLFTYLFGTEIQNKIDNNNAEEILSRIDSKMKYKSIEIDTLLHGKMQYREPKEKENTRSLQNKKTKTLKLPKK